MQIDWLSCYARPRDPVYRAGRIWTPARDIRITPDGQIESERPALSRTRGSFDSAIQWGSETGSELYVSGNHVKFLQGHNLFGSSDYLGLLWAAGMQCRQAGTMPFPGPSTWRALDLEVIPTRIDITRSFRFDSQRDAEAWLRESAATAHSGRMKKDLTNIGTVYFGKNSRRWSLKMYLKAPELRARGRMHRLTALLKSSQRRRLLDWSEGVIRFELTLRGMEIKDNPTLNLGPAGLLDTWQTYFDRIDFNRNAEAATMTDITETELKPAERNVLTLWRCGVDPRRTTPRATWYRYRGRILQIVGVDIAEPATPVEAQKVVKLDAKGWDPEPLADLVYDPEPIAQQYRLKVAS